MFVVEPNKIGRRPHAFKPAETLRAFLIDPEQEHLFTFPRIPGVPPTNNNAEQSLRNMVIMRKVSFGARSDRGMKRFSFGDYAMTAGKTAKLLPPRQPCG